MLLKNKESLSNRSNLERLTGEEDKKEREREIHWREIRGGATKSVGTTNTRRSDRRRGMLKAQRLSQCPDKISTNFQRNFQRNTVFKT